VTSHGGSAHQPTISVIVPVRNDPQRLGICLEALRGSTFRDHEIIVVDDSSTDMTPAVAEMLGARVIRLPARQGPGLARNRGAAAARGRYLMFVDADVRVHPSALERAVAVLDGEPTIDALFGSYDAQPAAPGLVSQYKNLLHHYVHQTGRAEAGTFWAGCGAIRRDVFLTRGGFADVYRRPSIEDIELGARLCRAGHRIALRPEIQATHLKAWTLRSLLRSDVCDRAIPWTRLALQEGHLPNDLNLRAGARVSAVLALVLALSLLLAVRWPVLLLVAASALAGIALLNRGLYALFARQRGRRFLLAAVPLHLLYFLYSVLGFAVGAFLHLGDRLRPRSKRDDAVAPVAPAP
jgi:cellulose synthase/poly-beta-1,6-N-acetylglucosamine synthase-like glycosyltransferase